MRKCELYELLFALFPVKVWQNFLIHAHFNRCPSCQKKLVQVKEAQSVLLSPEEIKHKLDFWPEFAKAAREERREEKLIRPRHWRLVYGAVILIAVIIAGAWFMFVTKQERVSGTSEGFKINYIRIEDKPARAYLFQPKDSNIIFVWAEKTIEGE